MEQSKIKLTKLLPCPFCGSEAEFERFGNHNQSCVVLCTDCDCRLESNEVAPFCGCQWNRRAPVQQTTAVQNEIEIK